MKYLLVITTFINYVTKKTIWIASIYALPALAKNRVYQITGFDK